MEAEIALLNTSMSKIDQLTNNIDDALAPRRQRIEKLSGSHMLLKKLQFLFELPARLKQCVDMQAHAQAVKYYVKAAHVLEEAR